MENDWRNVPTGGVVDRFPEYVTIEFPGIPVGARVEGEELVVTIEGGMEYRVKDVPKGRVKVYLRREAQVGVEIGKEERDGIPGE